MLLLVLSVPIRRIVSVLSKDELYEIHQASLEILEDVGVVFKDDATLDLLKEHGADVDRKKQVARLPSYLVEETLKKPPTSVVSTIGKGGIMLDVVVITSVLVYA